MKNFFLNIFKSNTNESSKRFVGVLGSLSLIISLLIYHTDVLVNAVLVLSLGALGITAVEKIFKQKE